MVDWHPVIGSSRIVAEAYLAETETILVRFPTNVIWAYRACPPSIWRSFTAPGQSRGQYIQKILNTKPNGKWNG